MNDPRLLRVARQLLDEGYADDEATALKDAADILATAEDDRRRQADDDPEADDDPKDDDGPTDETA